MDNAKFCPAAQDWSTPDFAEPAIFLRRRPIDKQEEDHAIALRAISLRRFRNAGGRARRVNRLTVVTGKRRSKVRLG
jgi:hypothetical protein